MLKPMNRHIYKILIAVLGLTVIYHLATYRPAVVETINANTVEKKPINDPLEFEDVAPSVPDSDKLAKVDDSINPVAGVDKESQNNGEHANSELSADVGAGIEEGNSVDTSDSKAPLVEETEDKNEQNSESEAGNDADKVSGDNKNDNTANKQNPDVLSSIRDLSIFFDDLSKYRIKSPSIKDKYITEKAKEVFSTDESFLFSKDYLESVLDINDDTFQELKQSHQDYVNIHVKKLLDEYKISTFGNILETDPEWQSYKGTQGYVLIGGGRYSWLSYLVIKQIRATGSTIPIELFIPSSMEYEKDFCETALPRYNARCNVFDDKLGTKLAQDYGIGGYQYKMLALLSSKFENIIYLDSDNFPVRNPEFILNSEIFKETGMILWPDAWARTTNPKFYEIANVKVNEKKVRYNKYDEAQGKKPLEEYSFKDSWYHTFEGTISDPTSETGMMLLIKLNN